jgi:hypothetical protein
VAGSPVQVDRIDYLDQGSWPTGADGNGQSLTRSLPTSSGEAATSWVAATPTPGNATFTVLAPGDFDGDADVDGSDFLSWQRNLGRATGATRQQGDSDGDGDVDAADLGAWKTYFGPSNAVVAAATPAIAAAVMAPTGTETADEYAAFGPPKSDLVDLAVAVDLSEAGASMSVAKTATARPTPNWRGAQREVFANWSPSVGTSESTLSPNDDQSIDGEDSLKLELTDAAFAAIL